MPEPTLTARLIDDEAEPPSQVNLVEGYWRGTFDDAIRTTLLTVET
jgi:hypothetical protein